MTHTHTHTHRLTHGSNPSFCLLMRLLGRQHRDYPQSPFPVFVPPLKPSLSLLSLCVCVCVTVVTIQQLLEIQIHSHSDLFWTFAVFVLVPPKRDFHDTLLCHTMWLCGLSRTMNAGWVTDSDSIWNQRLTSSKANISPAEDVVKGWSQECVGNICLAFCFSDLLIFIQKGDHCQETDRRESWILRAAD